MLNLRIKTSRGKVELGEVAAVWSRFARYVRSHWPRLLLAFGASLAAVSMALARPWPIKVIFDYVLTDKMRGKPLANLLDQVAATPTQVLAWVCGGILLIALLDSLFAYLRDVTLATVSQRVVGKIRQDLFAHLQTLPPSAFERRKTGALLMRLTGDIQMLRQMLVNAVLTGTQSLLTILAMVAAMFVLNWKLALLAVASFPITALASWRIARKMRIATKKAREKESEVAAIAHDVLGAMALVQAFNREPIEQKRFSRQNRSTIRAGVKTTRLEAKLYQIISLASAASLCAILYFGVRAVLGGVMTAGDLLVFISYLRAVHKPARKLSKLTGQIAKSTACGQRVAELFELRPAVANRPGAIELGPLRGEIEFDPARFCYEPPTPALDDVCLHIRPGERVAIVGPTGAGKSTLIKLLLRFYDPQAGAVRVDGHDLRDVTMQSLRRQIGWVHQDTVLFGMTVRENLTLGNPDATDEEIWRVAARVRADEFIARLPDGLDTVLGNAGATLSGGQRQRIALARALLRDPRILLLDEPATGLDILTRRVVEQAWLSADNRATTLVICHRLTQMQRFDRVVVLEAGRIVAAGSHEELLESCPSYAAACAAAAAESATHLRLAEGGGK